MSYLGPRFARLTLGIVLAYQLQGCAPKSQADPADPEGDLQSICGPASDLRDVELYDGRFGPPTAFVNRHRRAVGLVRWRTDLFERYREQRGDVAGKGWCTGTLIGPDLFLTAGHCLDNGDTETLHLPREKGGIPLEPSDMAREFTIEFRYEKPALADAAVYDNYADVVRLEEYSRSKPDYALFRLSGNPGLANGVAHLSPTDSKPGNQIALIQHPHQEPMKVGAGPVTRLLDSKITYATIDTLDGSSGSGILDGESGKLVGIHTNGGCSRDGDGENYGVTVGALLSASKMLPDYVDRSRDFYVGDWNNDGVSDLAVFVDGCLYPDVDRDGAPDVGARQCPRDPSADQYFVGKWQPGTASQLGWRRGDCVFLDSNPARGMCFPAPFEVLVADWDGNGQSDLGIRHGRCIDFDTDLDGTLDRTGYCIGDGVVEDDYLVGNWDGSGDSIALRRANKVYFDLDRDGTTDPTYRIYGNGGNEDQYLVGDWTGSGHSELAVRRGTTCSIYVGDGVPDATRAYRDFWTKP